MTDETDDIGRQATDIANDAHALFEGRPSAACLAALAMLIGYSAAVSAKPDLDETMRILRTLAEIEFKRLRPLYFPPHPRRRHERLSRLLLRTAR